MTDEGGVPVTATAPAYDVVVPTLGRPGLQVLLDALGVAVREGPPPGHVYLVDDRRAAPAPLTVRVPESLSGRVGVLPGRGRGPAAARNVGWRAGAAAWVAFLDDDVVVPPDWCGVLAIDLAAAAPDVGGVSGRIEVPLPTHRRPTDWERNTAALATAQWATADLAYRRRALAAVGGFDEGFPRAYREDADLALRVQDAGYRLVRGRRRVCHPVRPAGFWASVRAQAGNADDVAMWRRHGRGWRRRAGSPPGRFRRHAAVTVAGLGSLSAAATGRSGAAAVLALAWAVGTGEFAVARIRPGPRTRDEVVRMAVTSAVLPPAAVLARLCGLAGLAAGGVRRRPTGVAPGAA